MQDSVHDSVQQSEFHNCVTVLPRDIGEGDHGDSLVALADQALPFRDRKRRPTDFASLYGAFYGAYRFGDSGDPRTGQLLRMLQFESGV